ncbi:hypothetical protein AAVH_06810, partial [Aphelenchoides avenae]
MAASIDHLAEIWQDAYDTYLPCDACRMVEKKRTQGGWHRRVPWTPSVSSVADAVEKFHVPSKYFGKQLDVELYFAVGDPQKDRGSDVPARPPTAPKEDKAGLLKLVIRLVDGVCRGSTKAVARKRCHSFSKSIRLISDFALEVYGFLDRPEVGSSLVANRSLHEQIFRLRHLLPVHHLMCEFEKEQITPKMDYSTGDYKPEPPEDYWLRLHHFRRDLPYSDVRRFKIPPTAELESTAADCARILRCLSNSHVADFKAPPKEPCFTIKMLAALVNRNFSLERLRLRAFNDPLTDYRSLDAVFGGGMRLAAFNLWIHEDCFHHLVKTTDFFRMPAMQRISEFKLLLISFVALSRGSKMNTTVVVPETFCIGYIIGHDGRTIRNIAERTKTKIRWPNKSNPADRKFTVYGYGSHAATDVDKAVDEILRL